jgi:riboflavin synthase
MFTGIIETLGIVKNIKKDQENVHFTIESDITNELKIDQSVAHNGVCLTVVNIDDREYVVTAIKETLDKTN